MRSEENPAVEPRSPIRGNVLQWPRQLSLIFSSDRLCLSGMMRFPLGLWVGCQGLSQGKKKRTLSGIELQFLGFTVVVTA
jgi:hypothetical protein